MASPPSHADAAPAGQLLDIGTVAGAYGERPAVLKSWCTQHILQPPVEARGTGTRRGFDRGSAAIAGILIELRRLLGTHFRPGEIADAVASWTPGSLEWALLDRCDDPEPVLLVFYRDAAGRLATAFMELNSSALAHLVTRHTAFVIVNLATIRTCLRDVLRR